MLTGLDVLRERDVIAVVSFRRGSIYAVGSASWPRPVRIIAPDPRGRFHKLHHLAGNPDGVYEDDSPEYWHELTEALEPARAILLAGHGKGRANAALRWLDYAQTHRPDVAAKVVADVRVDIDRLDDRQVARLAAQYFIGAPPRNEGDSRWGETADPRSAQTGTD